MLTRTCEGVTAGNASSDESQKPETPGQQTTTGTKPKTPMIRHIKDKGNGQKQPDKTDKSFREDQPWNGSKLPTTNHRSQKFSIKIIIIIIILYPVKYPAGERGELGIFR